MQDSPHAAFSSTSLQQPDHPASAQPDRPAVPQPPVATEPASELQKPYSPTQIARELYINEAALPSLDRLPRMCLRAVFAYAIIKNQPAEQTVRGAEDLDHARTLKALGSAHIQAVLHQMLAASPAIEGPYSKLIFETLASNAYLARVARASGLESELTKWVPPDRCYTEAAGLERVLAEAYSTYIGLVWQDFSRTSLPHSEWFAWASKLFDANALPKLHADVVRLRESTPHSILPYQL